MSESITYGSYSFPKPIPFVGQGVEPVYAKGKVDNFVDSIELVGNLTGEDLKALDLQKMQMISGLLSTFETLTISNSVEDKVFLKSKPQSISFSDSDLTTVLPYSVNFQSYSSGTFSEFFGISDPIDTWSFSESDGNVVEASHRVSAKGLKVDENDALLNARNFVNSRIGGYQNLSLFLTGQTGYLTSRSENIDKAQSSYEISEVYKYNIRSGAEGILTSNTQIAFEKENGITVNVTASVQGNMGAVKNDGLIDTGAFTATQATELAINSVASSLSNYESGAYTFIERGPKTASFTIDSGANKVDFNYVFSDPENIDQVGNVLHKRSSSVSASKDSSKVNVTVNGEFIYNSPFDVLGTGDPATGSRFLQVDEQFSGLSVGSGFLNLAVEALQDFTGDATGYHISGDYINPEPLSRSINKKPSQSSITYEVQFDNRVDLSSGTLSGLKVSITDKKPLELSGIVPSLGGFAKQKINNRTAGEFQVSANCEGDTGNLDKLKEVISGHLTGIFTFSESSTLNDDTISFNTSRYY